MLMAESLVVGEPAKHRRLELLDLLRFCAAIMVVVFHWLFNGIDNGKVSTIDFGSFAPVAIYGVYGVHLFFLISGFVIADSARGRTAGQFVVSRAIRLFPAYWVAMIITTLVVNGWGSEAMRVTPLQFLANTTMVPAAFGQPAVDGVYWTLTVELTFYFLVLVVLVCGLGRFLDLVFPAWAMLMLAVTVVAPDVSLLPYLGGYYSLFAAGAIFAAIRRRGVSVFGASGLAAAVSAAIIFVIRDVERFNRTHSLTISTSVAVALLAIFLFFMASLCIPRADRIKLPFSRPISDLTYPVYLLHAHIGYTILGKFATEENVVLVYSLMFCGLLITAALLHFAVEVLPKRFWRSSFGLLRGPFDAVQDAVESLRQRIRARN